MKKILIITFILAILGVYSYAKKTIKTEYDLRAVNPQVVDTVLSYLDFLDDWSSLSEETKNEVKTKNPDLFRLLDEVKIALEDYD